MLTMTSTWEVPASIAEQLVTVAALVTVAQTEPPSAHVSASSVGRSEERWAEKDLSAAHSTGAVTSPPQTEVEPPGIGQRKGDTSAVSSMLMVVGRQPVSLLSVPPVAGGAAIVEALQQARSTPSKDRD